MAKISDEPLQKHTLLLFEGDYQKLQMLYPEAGGAAIIIRTIIRNHIERIETPVNLNEVDVKTNL